MVFEDDFVFVVQKQFTLADFFINDTISSDWISFKYDFVFRMVNPIPSKKSIYLRYIHLIRWESKCILTVYNWMYFEKWLESAQDLSATLCDCLCRARIRFKF